MFKTDRTGAAALVTAAAIAASAGGADAAVLTDVQSTGTAQFNGRNVTLLSTGTFFFDTFNPGFICALGTVNGCSEDIEVVFDPAYTAPSLSLETDNIDAGDAIEVSFHDALGDVVGFSATLAQGSDIVVLNDITRLLYSADEIELAPLDLDVPVTTTFTFTDPDISSMLIDTVAAEGFGGSFASFTDPVASIIPLPASSLLLLGGLGVLAARGRRRAA